MPGFLNFRNNKNRKSNCKLNNTCEQEHVVITLPKIHNALIGKRSFNGMI